MSNEIVTKKETPIESVNTNYLYTLCMDIAHNSPKAHKTFNKNKLKKKYVDELKKAIASIENALTSGDLKEIEKSFDKAEQILSRYSTLDAKMKIKPTYNNLNQKVVQVSESDTKDIAAIREVFQAVKDNSCKYLIRESKESENRKMVENINQAEEAKVREANENNARETFYTNVTNAINRDEYMTGLKGDADFRDQLAENTYKGDPSTIVRSYENNPERKRLEEMKKAKEAVGNSER